MKRPMFKLGGKANSQGTGVTSGLDERVDLKDAGFLGTGSISRITIWFSRTTIRSCTITTTISCTIYRYGTRFRTR